MEDEEDVVSYLTIILDEQPACSFTSESPASGFRFHGKTFLRVGGRFCGFYDGLRDPSGAVVGVCLLGMDNLSELRDKRDAFLTMAKKLSYVKIEYLTFIKIFFDKTYADCPGVAEDGAQEFDESSFYFSDGGLFALTFGTQNISSEDIDHELAKIEIF